MKKLAIIVDDDEGCAELAELILKRENFETVIFRNGEDAIEYMGEYSDAGVIITDLNMFGKTGLDVLEFSAKNFPKMKRILTSSIGWDDIEKRKELEEQAAKIEAVFCTKGKIKELLSLIKSFTGN